MGFFKRFGKHKKDDGLAPPPPIMARQGTTSSISDMPPAPEPINIGHPQGMPPAPSPDSFDNSPDTDFSIPPLESSNEFQNDPLSERPYPTEEAMPPDNFDSKLEEHNSSFAEKFGTHPDPEVQQDVHEDHQQLQEQPQTQELPQEQPQEQMPQGHDDHSDFKFGSSPVLEELESVSPNPVQNDMKMSANELPLDKQMDAMIDEHVDEKIESPQEEEIPQPMPIPESMPSSEPIQEVPIANIEENHEEPQTLQKRILPKIDPTKPLFVRLEFCGDLVRELTDVKNVLKKRDDDYLAFVELEKELDGTLSKWKKNIETLQTSLIKMDKAVFKD